MRTSSTAVLTAVCLAVASCGQPRAATDGGATATTATSGDDTDRGHRVVASGERFACTPTAVWDGDGPVWCDEGPKVRLAGIAAREHDETCRSNQPCPAATGVAARDALVTLLGGATGTRPEGHVKVNGPRLACISEGGARGDRTAAWCELPDGRDLSCAMIAGGTALRWPKYDLEDRCRAKGVG